MPGIMPCVICDVMPIGCGKAAGRAEAGAARRGRLGRARLGLPSPTFSDELAGLRTAFTLPSCRWAAGRKKGHKKGMGARDSWCVHRSSAFARLQLAKAPHLWSLGSAAAARASVSLWPGAPSPAQNRSCNVLQSVPDLHRKSHAFAAHTRKATPCCLCFCEGAGDTHLDRADRRQRSGGSGSAGRRRLGFAVRRAALKRADDGVQLAHLRGAARRCEAPVRGSVAQGRAFARAWRFWRRQQCNAAWRAGPKARLAVRPARDAELSAPLLEHRHANAKLRRGRRRAQSVRRL